MRDGPMLLTTRKLKPVTLTQTYGPYRIGSSFNFTEPQLRRLVHLFDRRPQAIGTALEGRSAVLAQKIEDMGPVVVKSYTRGGFIRHLVKRRYLKTGKTRGQIEYHLLQKVRSVGINAPEPVAFAYRGHLFYLAWLVTREICQPISLARLSRQNENHARKAMVSAMAQILLLIQNNILHVDLHPGNVVIDKNGRVFLVDFDRARLYSGNKEKLKSRYRARWQRAVVKHRLPGMLGDIMADRL